MIARKCYGRFWLELVFVSVVDVAMVGSVELVCIGEDTISVIADSVFTTAVLVVVEETVDWLSDITGVELTTVSG